MWEPYVGHPMGQDHSSCSLLKLDPGCQAGKFFRTLIQWQKRQTDEEQDSLVTAA